MKFEVFYPKEYNVQPKPWRNGGGSTCKLEVSFTPGATLGDFLDFVLGSNLVGAHIHVSVKSFFGFIPSGLTEVWLGRVVFKTGVPIDELKSRKLVSIVGRACGPRARYFVGVE